MNKRILHNSGFTLIETFVAVTILLIAILGPMALFSKAIHDGLYAKNQVTAFYLAQEGLEAVINGVKNNKLSGRPSWLENFDSCISSACVLSIEDPDTIRTSSLNSSNDVLYQDNSGRYTAEASGNTPTVFSRTIKITPILSDADNKPYAAEVVSTVTWNDRPDLDLIPVSRATSLTTVIYDQQ